MNGKIHDLQNNNSWEADSERLILYADIMGFKNRVFSQKHEDLKKKFVDFILKLRKKIKPLGMSNYLKVSQFSDSIIIVVNGVNQKMFNLISKSANCLMHEAIRSGFPIKGVIAQGLFTYDKANEIYFGRPLVDAYLLEEDLFYYGIAVHHSAEKTIKKYKDNNNKYSKTKIYLKKGMTSHYHLCWNLCDENLSNNDITGICNDWLDKIEESVSSTPRMYIDNTREIFERDYKEFLTKENITNAKKTK